MSELPFSDGRGGWSWSRAGLPHTARTDPRVPSTPAHACPQGDSQVASLSSRVDSAQTAESTVQSLDLGPVCGRWSEEHPPPGVRSTCVDFSEDQLSVPLPCFLLPYWSFFLLICKALYILGRPVSVVQIASLLSDTGQWPVCGMREAVPHLCVAGKSRSFQLRWNS